MPGPNENFCPTPVSGGVDHLGRARRQDGLFDRRDPVAAHGDVVDAVDGGRRTNATAAVKQRIIFRILRHFAVLLFGVIAFF